MADWLNRVTIAGPRNGTTTHTVTPSSGTVVAGTLFTPTAGRFLLCAVEGGVTTIGPSAGTPPSGWTLPSGGFAVNGTGLYVFTKTAAGSDTLVANHNGSNYPVVFDFYEFPSGTTFSGAASGTSVASGGAGPNLTGLTGSNWTAGVHGWGMSSVSSGTGTTTWSAGTKLVDTTVNFSATDGYVYSLTATDADTATSKSYTATVAGVSPSNTMERLVFAVKVPAVAATANPRPTTVYRNAVHRSSNY